MLNLRPYQTNAVQHLRIALAGGSIRVMLYSPTGSGKTEMALSIIHGALGKGKRAAFLCNRIHLVEQASRRFYASGIEHGIIQGENTRDVHSPVLIGSIDTVARRGCPDVDVIVIDEAHAVAGSKRFRDVVFRNSARPIIGLSATPFARGLGKTYPELGREPLFQKLVEATTITELIDAGFLVDADFYAPAEPDLKGVKVKRNEFGETDYSEADLGDAVDKPALIGDIVTHWLKLAKGTATVVFATNIAHSKHIVEQFQAAGVAAEHLDCYTDESERKDILVRIADGTTTVISNVSILAEGWDFPACRTLILARPTKSLTRYVQMVGRVLRPFPGKDRALVLDHSGTVRRLGFPTDDLPLKLDDDVPRGEAKPQHRDDPLPKACPSCAYLKPAKVHTCPKCGFEPERQSDVEVGAGDLVPIRRSKTFHHQEKQSVWSQLLAIAERRGYSPGWCAHKYREYTGVWPRGLRNDKATPSPELKAWLTSRAIAFAKANEKAEASHVA